MHNRLSVLRRLAHDRINAGELPSSHVGTVSEDEGSGEPCALCGAPITFNEVVTEQMTGAGEQILRFHRACHAVWREESHDMAPRPRRVGAEH